MAQPLRTAPRLTEDHWFNPIWLVRGLPLAACALLLAALLCNHHEALRGMCMGGALGLLIGFCAFSWSIKTVVRKDIPQPSDVTPYSIT